MKKIVRRILHPFRFHEALMQEKYRTFRGYFLLIVSMIVGVTIALAIIIDSTGTLFGNKNNLMVLATLVMFSLGCIVLYRDYFRDFRQALRQYDLADVWSNPQALRERIEQIHGANQKACLAQTEQISKLNAEFADTLKQYAEYQQKLQDIKANNASHVAEDKLYYRIYHYLKW